MEETINTTGFPSRLFITGTDTGIGKTVVAAILLAGLRGSYWKPIQSGLDDMTDTEWVRQKTGLDAGHFYREGYRLKRPASPHIAAAEEGVTIDLDKLIPPDTLPGETLLIEGAGGVMVPINETRLMTDLIRRMAAPTLVVAPCRLGMINHTLLTVTHLRRCDIPVLGVVINGGENHDYRQAVEKYGQVPVLAQIERLTDINPMTLKTRFDRFDLKRIQTRPDSGERR